ncbi:threonine/serine dehydratase [Neoroseomonas oryzicola]|uniref:Threonine/serine dehydratase n=1 Tax=Neoroseomonas oryzicola TaxID=535904 RepID=A0A9X9WIZ8_9PROT|nr:threonine/serine dehydratase [Neoroseomonas oryzicola]MBR0660308.1 threonine/serine dehydratase [Neoroseomonas oryzicola]NKE18005.1 threonine/serine dehydratase [Neoroseomonas oryzicola]
MVTQDDIRAAAARIAPHVRRTPVIRLSAKDTGLGFPLAFKLEQLQVTGSFKPRGAFNRMLSASVPAAGVVAASGGNHGIAVAHAAKVLGVKAEIFVPEITPEAKRARIAATGATLTVGGAAYDQARRASEARAAETGALIVHAYDQAEVLAGQGTVGLEFEEDAPELTHLIVAAGGGGLYGGIASWYRDRLDMVVAEPDECPTLLAAGLAGQPVDVPSGGIAADSLGARRVGALPYEVLMSVGARVVVVKDEIIRDAQRWLWDRLRVVAEPGGATAFAALLSGAWAPPEGAEVGVLVCGANCDPASILG